MRHRLPQAGGVAVVIVVLTAVAVWPTAASGKSVARTSPTGIGWSRTLEPVILSASEVTEFLGASVDELFAYAYSPGVWTEVPLQIDEVDASGRYTAEDGLLDANDELVFMAADAGEQAPQDWIDNLDSRNYPRIELQVANPLDPLEKGWVYLYRSASLMPPALDYVDWDGVSHQIVGGTYQAGLTPEHFGIDSLKLNGSAGDALDRTKVRATATCKIPDYPRPVDIELNEELIVVLLDVWDAVPDVDGPVRVGGGTVQANSWSYSSMFNSLLFLDLGNLAFDPCDTITVSSVRLSDDWLDPSSTGMAPATYFDANTPAGVAVDGNPDTIASAPANGWRQMSGAQGSVVVVQDLSLGAGVASNYYRDDSTVDTHDTGDQKSYGDAGLAATNPQGEVRFASTTYVLEPSLPNLGATYRSNYDNPIVVSAVTQSCGPQSIGFTASPFPVYAGVATTLTAGVGSGIGPFNYAWQASACSPDDGASVTCIFGAPGLYPVTLTVANECGSVQIVRTVFVYEPGQAHVTYLPFVARKGP